MGTIGVPELIVIFVIALIVFGPKKLPELGKSLGKGLAEFRKASNELRSTIEEEVRAIESEPSAQSHSSPNLIATSQPSGVQSHPDEHLASTPKSTSEANVDAH